MRLVVGLVALLILAGSLRTATFAIPHDRGDQLIWAGVTANLAARGAAGYTLRGLATPHRPLGLDGALVTFVPVEGKGPLLEGFLATGERYWDGPLVNQPPGFFAVLTVSHALLGSPADGHPIVGRDPSATARFDQAFAARYQEGYAHSVAALHDLPEAERRERIAALEAPLLEVRHARERELARALIARTPPGVVAAQLWATLPPVLSDLATLSLVVVATLGLARRAGARAPFAAAGLAGLLWACDPLALYCSARVLSNATLAAACALALVLDGLALDHPAGRARALLSAAAGLAAGFAIATKVSAVLLVPAIVAGRLLHGGTRAIGARDGRGRDLSLALLVALAVAPQVPWWLLQWQVLGHPFGFAWRNQADRSQVSLWGRLVANRDALYYLRSLGRSPLVAVGLAGAGIVVGRSVREAIRGAPGSAAARTTPLAAALFSIAVVLAAATFEEKEARHLLLAYPPLLVLGACGVTRVAQRARRLGIAALVPIGLAVAAAQARQGLFDVVSVSRAP